jgi:hypothetical protein
MMTDHDLLIVLRSALDPPPVTVRGGDYSYDGWLVSVFKKRKGQWRAVVEDEGGRLFIHNASQVNPEPRA